MPQTPAGKSLTESTPGARGASNATDNPGVMWIAIFALILMTAFVLRLYHLSAQSFWCDEFLTAELTVGRGYAHEAILPGKILERGPRLADLAGRADWWSVWPNQVAEGYPPFYVLMARFWRASVGESDVALRWLSVLSSIGTLLFLVDAVRMMNGRSAALWAGGIAALAGPQIEFAQEARGYAMLLMFGTAACWALARMERWGASWRRATVFGFSLGALLLMHYYAWGFAVALGLYAVFRLRGNARRQAVGAALSAAVIAAALWGPWVLRQVNQSHVSVTRIYFGDARPGQVVRWADRMGRLPVRYFYEPMKRSRRIAVLGGVAYVMLAWVAWRRRDLRLWVVAVIGVVGLVGIVDLVAKTRQLDLMRYTLLASPAAYALAAAAPLRMWRPWPTVIPLMVLIACGLSLNTAYEITKPNWRAVAADWGKVAHSGEVTIFSGSNLAGPYSASMTYASTSFYRRSTGPVVLLDRPADTQLLEQLRLTPGVILVASALSPEASALLPGCVLERVGFEPFVAKLYRVRWRNEAEQPIKYDHFENPVHLSIEKWTWIGSIEED